jgi:tripartite-type tricarboxylate transporter receptor subunit TctC
MKLLRRQFLHVAAGAMALPPLSRSATAQTYPTRPITMIVPFAAGGAGDTIARSVAERMRGPLGQSIIIENVTGADGTLGVGRAAHARPDGYTLCIGTMDTQVLNGAFYSLPYDVLNDLVPVVPLVTIPVALFAKRTMPAEDLTELIAWLRANPNKASVGVIALDFRLMTVLLQRETSANFALVPYRGGAVAVQDLAAGQIDLLIGTSVFLPQVRAGSIKAYAVTSDARSAHAPDIPTFAEMGLPALSWSEWYGLFAPKATPKSIMAKLNAAAVEALADPVLHARLADVGFDFFPPEKQTPEAFAAMQKADAEKWWPIVKEYGIKPE